MAVAMLRALMVCVCAAQLLGEVAALVPEDPDPWSYNGYYVAVRKLPCLFPNDTFSTQNVNGTLAYFFDLRDNINVTCDLYNTTSCFNITDFASRCVVTVMNGFNNKINDTTSQDALENFKAANSDCILIIIIHYKYTGSNISTPIIDVLQPLYYEKACAELYPIASSCVKYLFEPLYNLGVRFLLVLAHSLGCHIMAQCGVIARYLFGNIVCADPAGPACFNHRTYTTIKSGQSNCTICYYSNKGGLGIVNPIDCDVNIIVNNGWYQPNCPVVFITDLTGGGMQASCCHAAGFNAATFPYAMPNLWNLTECDTLANYQSGACNGNYVGTSKSVIDVCRKGKYYMTTNNYDITAPSKISNYV